MMIPLGLGSLGLGAAAAAFSARWNWWRPRVEGLVIPMYHHLGSATSKRHSKLWVSVSDFRSQMQSLLKGGWTPIFMSELAAASDGNGTLPDRPALVTFDDGTADNYELALPVLQELGVKANIFVVVEGIDGHTRWENPVEKPWQRMLSWNQMLTMRDSGLVEFGSHTMRHPNLVVLPLEDARWEISESKRRLESRLEVPIHGFAYPFGSGADSSALREIVREAGYYFDFSIRQGITPLPWEFSNGALQRVLVRGDDTAYDFHLNLTRGKARF